MRYIARPKSDALMRALAERIADPAFGLQAAQCWHPSNLGTLGYAWLSSSTLHTGLKRVVRYWRIVIADVAVRLEETPEGVEFVHTPPKLDSIPDGIRGDIVMAIIYDMCRTNFGHAFSPRRVAFRHPAPADASPVRDAVRLPGRIRRGCQPAAHRPCRSRPSTSDREPGPCRSP